MINGCICDVCKFSEMTRRGRNHLSVCISEVSHFSPRWLVILLELVFRPGKRSHKPSTKKIFCSSWPKNMRVEMTNETRAHPVDSTMDVRPYTELPRGHVSCLRDCTSSLVFSGSADYPWIMQAGSAHSRAVLLGLTLV